MSVTPDGERIIVLKDEPGAEQHRQQIVVVTNWFEALNARVPVK